MSSGQQPPRFEVVPDDGILADAAALAAYDKEVVAAAALIIEDLAHGRVVGKELGERHVSAHPTGLARVKSDIPGTRPKRFWLVYRQVDQRVREIVAIGPRDGHAI